MKIKKQDCRYFFLTAILFFHSAGAEIYHYIDDKGRKIYVDRLSQVPSQYLDQLLSRDEPKDGLTETELLALDKIQDISQKKREITKNRNEIYSTLLTWKTPFFYDNNSIVVPVKVSYGSSSTVLKLVVDTDSPITSVHKISILSLGVNDSVLTSVPYPEDSSVEAEEIYFDWVEVGPYFGENITASIIDSQGPGNSQGVLGRNFLNHTNYELDTASREVIWEPEKYQLMLEQLKELNDMEQKLNDKASALKREKVKPRSYSRKLLEDAWVPVKNSAQQ